MARELNSRSWYEHAVAYVDMEWPHASAKHRKGIAESLTGATMSLFASERGAPSVFLIRRALNFYVFNKARRDQGPPPKELATAVAWAERNTVMLGALADAALIRKVLV